MDKFLETYNFPGVNHEQIENMNSLITNKEIACVLSCFSHAQFFATL